MGRDGLVGEELEDSLFEKLPGAGASTIFVPGFLNSLPRLLLKTKSGFQGFLASIVQSPARDDLATSMPGASTWPLPLPYPEVFRRAAGSRVPGAHLKRLTCLQVAALDWMLLGCPAAAPLFLRLGRRLNAKQWTVVRMLEHLAVDRNFPEFVTAADMGRAAGKVEDFQDSLDALARAAVALHGEFGGYSFMKPSRDGCSKEAQLLRAGQIVGRADRNPVVTAKPLIAKRY